MYKSQLSSEEIIQHKLADIIACLTYVNLILRESFFFFNLDATFKVHKTITTLDS